MIYYFNGELAVRALVDEIRAGDAVGFYCPITWVELLCYPGLSEIEANQIRQLLRELTYVPLTEAVLDRAAQMGKIDAIASTDIETRSHQLHTNAIAFPLAVLLPMYIELRARELKQRVYVYLSRGTPSS